MASDDNAASPPRKLTALSRLFFSVIVILAAGCVRDGRSQPSFDPLLRDYALIVCVGAALQAGAEDYRAAGEALHRGAWWFVENSDERPETYQAVFEAASALGAEQTIENAPGRCGQFARGDDLDDVIEQSTGRE